MSTETTAAQESAATTVGSTTEAIETFVATVTDALERCDAPDETVASVKTAGQQLSEHIRSDHEFLRAAVSELGEEVEQLRDENDELREELESVRDELESVRDRAGRDRAELSSRVTDLEETVESHDDGETDDPDSPDANPGGQADEPAVPDAETSLEETIRLPEPVAEDSLSANQQRARSVARDIVDYAEYNHQYGNYSLTAKRLRIVLKAQGDDETAAHHETVKRVRKFLDRLGESEVTITEDRGGTKRLVFAESLVDRIEAHQDHGGVRGETVGTGVTT